MRARHYAVVALASLAAGFIWSALRPSNRDRVLGDPTEGATSHGAAPLRRSESDAKARRPRGDSKSDAPDDSLVAGGSVVETQHRSETAAREGHGATERLPRAGTSADADADAEGGSKPEIAKPGKHRTAADVREAALRWIGSTWEEVQGFYGPPNDWEAGEWYYARADHDWGLQFHFEEGWVKGVDALDPDWKPPNGWR